MELSMPNKCFGVLQFPVVGWMANTMLWGERHKFEGSRYNPWS